MTRWKLTIEYHGGPYCGWQRQDGQPSVQQEIEEAIQPQNRRRRIAASSPEPGSHGDSLSQFNGEAAIKTRTLQHQRGRSANKIVRSQRNVRLIAGQLDTARLRSDSQNDLVLQTHRLHNGPKVVVSVGAPVQDSEDQVDLGRRGDRHLA